MNQKMISETLFDSVFDYSSAFKYQSMTLSKSINHNKYKSVFSYHSVHIATDENTDDFKGENWISLLLRKAITLQFYLFAILLFPLSFWMCIKRIHTLERIVLMRLGKLQPVRGPGYTFVLPFIDMWTRVDLRHQTFDVTTSQVLTCDGAIVEVQSEVEYQVSDVVSYVTKLSQQEKSLKDLALCCLTNIVSEKDQEDLENNKEYLAVVLKDELNQASMKWGLEILNVYLSSVKVLKTAEPVDALGTIVTALKASMGHSSSSATAVFPIIGDTQAVEKTVDTEVIERERSVLEILKEILQSAEEKALIKEVSGCFKFDVVGHETNTIFCCFENGHASVVENPSNVLDSDISVTLSENNVRDFLENKISPLEAYMEGKMRVVGDWRLLRPLAKIFEGPL